MGCKTNKNQNGYTMFNDNTSSKITQGEGNQRDNNSETRSEDNYLNFPPLATVGNNLRSRFQSVVERQLSSLRGPEEFTFAPRKTFSSSFSQTDFDFQETKSNSKKTEQFPGKPSTDRVQSDPNEMDKIQLWNVIVKSQELTQDLSTYRNEFSSHKDEMEKQHSLSMLDNEIGKKLPEMESMLDSLLSKGGGNNLRPSVRQVVLSKITDLYNKMHEVSALSEKPDFLSNMKNVIIKVKMFIHNLQRNPIAKEERSIRPIIDGTRTAEVEQSEQIESDRQSSIEKPFNTQQRIVTEPKRNLWLREDKTKTGYEAELSEPPLPRQKELNQRYIDGIETELSKEMTKEYPTNQDARQKISTQQYATAQNEKPRYHYPNEQYANGSETERSTERARIKTQPYAASPLGQQYTTVAVKNQTQQMSRKQHTTDIEAEPSATIPTRGMESRQYAPDPQTTIPKGLQAHKILNQQYTTDNKAELSRAVPKQTMPSRTFTNAAESDHTTDKEDIRPILLTTQKITGNDDEPLIDIAKLFSRQYTSDTDEKQPALLSTQQVPGPDNTSNKEKTNRWMSPQDILSRQHKADAIRQYATDTEAEQSRWLPAKRKVNRQYASDTEEQSRIMPTELMASQQYTTDTETESSQINKSRWFQAKKILGRQYTSDSEEEQVKILPTQQMANQQYAVDPETTHPRLNESRWLSAQKILDRQHAFHTEEQSMIMPKQQMANQTYSVDTETKSPRLNQSRWLSAQKILGRQHAADSEEQSIIMPTQQMANQQYALDTETESPRLNQSRWLSAQKIVGRQHATDTEEQSMIMPKPQIANQQYAVNTETEPPRLNQSRWLSAQKLVSRQHATDSEEQSMIMPTPQMANQQYAVNTDTESPRFNQSRWLSAKKILGRQHATDTEEQTMIMPTQQMSNQQYALDSETESPRLNQSRWLSAQKILGRRHAIDAKKPIMPTQEMANQQYALDTETESPRLNQSRWLSAQKILGRQHATDAKEQIMPTQQMANQQYAVDTETESRRLNQSRWLSAQKILGRQHVTDSEEQSMIVPTQQMANQQYAIDTTTGPAQLNYSRWLPGQSLLARQYTTDTEVERSIVAPNQEAQSLQSWTDSEVTPSGQFKKAAKRHIQHQRFRSAFESQRNRMQSQSKSQTLHEELSTDSDEGTISRTTLNKNDEVIGTVPIDPDAAPVELKDDTEDTRPKPYNYSKRQSDFSPTFQKRNLKSSAIGNSGPGVSQKWLLDRNSVEDDIPTDFLSSKDISIQQKNKEVLAFKSMDKDSGGESEVVTDRKSTKADSSLSSESSGLVVSDPSSEIMSEYSEYSTDIDVTLPVMSETPRNQHAGKIGDKIVAGKYLTNFSKSTGQDSVWNKERFEEKNEASIDHSLPNKLKVKPAFVLFKKGDLKKKSRRVTEILSSEAVEITKRRNKHKRSKIKPAKNITERGGEYRTESKNQFDITSFDEQVPEKDRQRYKRKYKTSIDGKVGDDLEGELQKRKRTRINKPLEEENSAGSGLSNIDNGTDAATFLKDTKVKVPRKGKVFRIGYKAWRDQNVINTEDSNTSVYYSPSSVSSGGESAIKNEDIGKSTSLDGNKIVSANKEKLEFLPVGNKSKEEQNKQFMNFREKRAYPCGCQNCKKSYYGRKIVLSKNQTQGQKSYNIIDLFVNCLRFCGESVVGLLFLMVIVYVFSSSSPRPIPGTISNYLDLTHIYQPPF